MDAPLLPPSELYNRRKSKDASRLRAYNTILSQIYNRVRSISQLPQSQCYLLYSIPPFILGLPKLDMEDCVVYLIYQLRHAGYQVRYTPPNVLYLSWAHHERSYIIEQSPIMNAMVQSAERSQAELERKEKEAARLLQPRRSQQRAKAQTPGFAQRPSIRSAPPSSSSSFASSSFASSSSPSAGITPSASEYVPPSSFLQTMMDPPAPSSQAKSVPEYFRR